MFFLTYIFCKVVVFLLRTFPPFPAPPAKPDAVLQIPSRDSTRKIKAHAYRPSSPTKPCPVLVNLHGSGFVMTMHGTDDAFCREMSQRTEYTVLDIQYRLAPENPFPAALNDVQDVVNWVLQQPDKFDHSRVVLSGFSAGGNLALAASSTLFPRETFYAVIAFYPPVDLYTQPESKPAPDPSGKPLPAPLARLFDKCYIPASHDTKDPRISPLYAQADRFPDRVLILTAAMDGLAPEAEQLAVNIGKEAGRKVVSQRMEGCNHGWNLAPKTTVEREATAKAYDMVVAMLEG
ncbi:putative esterase/lipase [Aspergillus stella-maris]|uniref:putative esterase/lipase n=1 Tax=Aspergillus stella-maris TaxID=1810926 RepID=UPI003CCE1481